MYPIKLSIFLKDDMWRLLYVFGTKNTNPMQKYKKRSRVKLGCVNITITLFFPL